MKVDALSYIPHVRLILTRDEIESLAMNADRHYDFHCRAANQRGGIIYGLRNALESDKAEWTFDMSDIDLLMKVCEQGSDCGLSLALLSIFKTMKAAYEKANKGAVNAHI